MYTVRFSAVRYGRVPKRSKSMDQATQQQQQPNSTTPDTDPVDPVVIPTPEDKLRQRHQLAVYDVVLTIAQSHHCHCLTTDDKVKALARKTLSLVCGLKFYALKIECM